MQSKWCSGSLAFGFQGKQAFSQHSGTYASCQYNQGLVLHLNWYDFLPILQNLGHAFCKLKVVSLQSSAITMSQLYMSQHS